jgi:plastocyanin
VKDQNTGNFDLTVFFRAGGVYRYFSVEQEDIASVIFASSIGSMFNKLFTQAGKYRYAKIA